MKRKSNKSKKNELNDSHGTNYHQRQPTPISTTFDVKKKTNPNTKKNIETTSTNVETNPKRISKPKTNTTNMSNTKTKDGLNSSKAVNRRRKLMKRRKKHQLQKQIQNRLSQSEYQKGKEIKTMQWLLVIHNFRSIRVYRNHQRWFKQQKMKKIVW